MLSDKDLKSILKQEKEDVKQFISDVMIDVQDVMISGFILDNLTPLKSYDESIPIDIHDLRSLSKIEKVIIAQLGELEHTSDWDPYLEIHLKDNTEFSSMYGYASFEVNEKDKTIMIDAPSHDDWDDADRPEYQRFYNEVNDHQYWVIKIEDIKSIQIQR